MRTILLVVTAATTLAACATTVTDTQEAAQFRVGSTVERVKVQNLDIALSGSGSRFTGQICRSRVVFNPSYYALLVQRHAATGEIIESQSALSRNFLRRKRSPICPSMASFSVKTSWILQPGEYATVDVTKPTEGNP